VEGVLQLLALPFPELLFRAQETHPAHHPPDIVQLSTSKPTARCLRSWY
jgi:hypothetical protein